MPKLILCFSKIPKTFIWIRVKQVTFLSEDWKKVARLKQCSLYSFRFREAYRKQTGSNVFVLLNKVSPLEHD